MKKRELPKGWPTVLLGEIIALEYGKSFPETKRKPGPFAVYGSNGIVGRAHEYLLEEKTIILGRKGSAGEVNYAEPKSWPIDTTYYLQIKNGRVLSLDLVYYLLKWLDPRRFVDTTVKPGLNRERVYEQAVPLPPLPVQEKIVQVLQRADEINRKRKEALRLSEAVLPSLFHELFGDPISNSKRLPVKKLGEVVDLQNGRAFKSSEWSQRGLPIIRIENLHKGEAPFNYFEGSLEERFLVQPGDLLLSWSGSLVSIDVNFWNGPIAALNQHIFNVRPKVGELSKSYLYCVLRFNLDRFRQQVHGTAGLIHIKKTRLNETPIPLPPSKEHQAFLQTWDYYSSLIERQRKAAREAEDAVSQLMHQAFTGELTADWEMANAEWVARQQVFHECLPRLLVLALLAEKARRASRPSTEVLVTALMKYIFLLQMEGNGRRLYHFVPYHYGPFAKELYSDLQRLQEEDLVRVDNDSEEGKTRITLTDQAKAEQALSALPNDLREDAATIISTYGDFDHNRLLKAVYEKYPAYARRSRLRQGRQAAATQTRVSRRADA